MSESYTLKEAASFLGVSYRTVRRYLKSGLPYAEVKGDKGVEYRLAVSDLVAFKRARLERPRQGAKLDDVYVRARKAATADRQSPNARTERTSADDSLAVDGLNKRLIETLESENAFLRQQIDSKDRQLADYHGIIKRLSHQNEVLTMICQGVEPKLLMKGGEAPQPQPETFSVSTPVVEEVIPQEEVAPPEEAAPQEKIAPREVVVSQEEVAPQQEVVLQQEVVPPVEAAPQVKTPLSKADVIAEAKRLHKAGKSAEEIRQFVAGCGYQSFSELLQRS